MNVTFNTNSLNSNRQNYYNFNRPKTAFTANPASTLADAAEQVVEQAAKDKSSFFAPFSKFYNNFTDGIAKYFTSKLVDSKPLGYVADKLKNSNNLFQHCLTIGSMITSGLYVQKTLTNDKLDKDRKNTLAVNQGLTFLVSTAGAYSLDKYLKIWWDDVTAKYVGLQLQDKNFEKDYKDIKAAINKVLAGAGHVELTPQNQHIRKLQHELVEQHNLESKSVGEGAERHLKIIGGTDYDAKIG